MERPTRIVGNAGVKLPIGFRFHPTDEELVVHYLKRKAFGLPLPALLIPDFDVFMTHPRSLPGDLRENNRYFFSRKERKGNGRCRWKRPAGPGYWKPVGKGREIVASASNQTVGIRRTLAYFDARKSCHGTKTRWFMHEYCLTVPATMQLMSRAKGEDWVVYRVFRSKRKANRRTKLCESNANQAEGLIVRPDCIDITMQDSSDFGPPPPDSPSSG